MTCPPDFLIVGTPRSGTTLVQRLATEHPDCAVPPETHFFVHLYPRLVRSGYRFPLHRHDLKECLKLYMALPTSVGLHLQPDALMNEHPTAGQRPLALFGAIVRHLAESSNNVGEKTPDHLLWWGPITQADDRVRIVWVVRDPRAVVASALKVQWGMNSPALLAQRWRLDVQSLRRAQRMLGPHRLLVVRFEDLVSDPDSERAAIWRFLDLQPDVPPRQAVESTLRTPREVWKDLAAQPVAADRAVAWRDQLPKESAHLVASICQREMVHMGYHFGNTRHATPRMDPADALKSVYLRLNRFRRQAWISRQTL